MIKSVMVMNTQGKPRLSRFYDSLTPDKQQELIRSVYGVLCTRAENVSNFVDASSIFGQDSRIVYKHYATLYFVFVFDSSENELAMLDLIQVFVETLDKCFKNVCELDIVYNHTKEYSLGTLMEYTTTLPIDLVRSLENFVFDTYHTISKMHTILDEIVFGGQVLETSSTEVMRAVEDISKLESASHTMALVTKSVSGWRNR